jgi:YrbI family 3-deoxy-D-manno-octulosonate 8-phosphate phosphatase
VVDEKEMDDLKNTEILAIIPARGGSKSIPRKNILDFAGHPLIAYSIAAGLKAEVVSRVIVSTDDEEIAQVARRYGAEVPFMRPAEYAQDDSLDLEVFQHALSWLAEHENYHPDIVIQLRPTSPVRPPDLVDKAVELLLEHPEADSVRGVVMSGQNPFKMWQMASDGHMEPLLTVDGLAEPFNAPRQALPQTYWQTGHIDAIRVGTILEKGMMSGEVVFPLVIDVRYTVDIDTPRDLERAERLMKGGELPVVAPSINPYGLPDQVDLIVLDFDGVLTDNRVWVDQNGLERVAAHRGDGMGISRLKKAGYEVIVLSTETNPVVAARCKKLNIPVYQGINDKGSALKKLFDEREINPDNVVYVGNDVNDLPCFSLVGCAVAVADAHPDVRPHADLILSTKGGYGAVRELSDLILSQYENRRKP